MATTHTLGDVVNYVSALIPRTAEDKWVDAICNMTQARIWNRFDWRETIAELPPFWLIPDVQDYGAPAVDVPADFQGLRKAFLVDAQSYPARPWILKVVRELDLESLRQMPDAIAYDKSARAFRLSRRAPGSFCSPRYMITGTYKREPVKVTKANYATTLLFSDDQYIQVWIDQMRAVATGFVGGGNRDALLTEAELSLLRMASNEGLNLGETPVSPSEGLLSTPFWFGGNGGLWG